MKIINALNTPDYRPLDSFTIADGDAFLTKDGQILYIYDGGIRAFRIVDAVTGRFGASRFPNSVHNAVVRRVNVELLIRDYEFTPKAEQK